MAVESLDPGCGVEYRDWQKVTFIDPRKNHGLASDKGWAAISRETKSEEGEIWVF